MGVITFLSDFGTADGYVSAVKGVIYSRFPEAHIVDITHDIKPGDVRSAAFVLSECLPFFPDKSLHIAVVDPFVGSARRILAVKTALHTVLAPDNGLLAIFLKEHIKEYTINGNAAEITLDDSVLAVEVTNAEFFREEVSHTFHARDIFAPVAAALSTGVNICELGAQVKTICGLPIHEPKWQGDILHGEVLYIDRFGNIITNITCENWPQSKDIEVHIGSRTIRGLKDSYYQSDDLLNLISSGGYLEIALNQGSAAAIIGVDIGDKVNLNLV